MSKIVLHWHNGNTPFVNKGESGLAYKHRLGHHPNVMNSRCVIEKVNLSKIDLEWKKSLTKKMETVKFLPGVPCTVYAGGYKFDMVGFKNRFKFVGNLANILLRMNKDHKNNYGITKEAVLASAK